jgi:hypothetical protein
MPGVRKPAENKCQSVSMGAKQRMINDPPRPRRSQTKVARQVARIDQFPFDLECSNAQLRRTNRHERDGIS